MTYKIKQVSKVYRRRGSVTQTPVDQLDAVLMLMQKGENRIKLIMTDSFGEKHVVIQMADGVLASFPINYVLQHSIAEIISTPV